MGPNDLRPEDLKALEQRLRSWRPSDQGLDADAVLFAAGRASARRPVVRRFAWPALAAALALAAAGLAVWGALERQERQELLARLNETPSGRPSPQQQEPAVKPKLNPSSYLALNARVRSEGVDALVASRPSPGPGTPPGPDEPVLRPWGNDFVPGP